MFVQYCKHTATVPIGSIVLQWLPQVWAVVADILEWSTSDMCHGVYIERHNCGQAGCHSLQVWQSLLYIPYLQVLQVLKAAMLFSCIILPPALLRSSWKLQ